MREMKVYYFGFVTWMVSSLSTETTLPPPGREYCQTESFKATCGKNEVVLMTTALYGRMRLGRCVQVDFGYIGCYRDVLPETDIRCSGRRECEIRIPDGTFDQTKPCLGDLTRYFEADYTCLKVVSANHQQCQSSYAIRVPGSSGFIASVVTEESGCGTPYRPWVIEVQPTQRINLTLWDFSVATGPRAKNGVATVCREYFIVKEESAKREEKICGGEGRVKNVYRSSTNKVEIHITNQRNPSKLYFLIQYEAIGCTEPIHPENTWIKHEVDHVTIGCATSDDTWRLTCTGGIWQGRIGNCTAGAQPRTKQLEEMIRGFVTSLPNGYAIMIIIGIAILISLVILILGLVYLRRKRARAAALHRHGSNDNSSASKELYNYRKCNDGSTNVNDTTLRRGQSEVQTIALAENDYGYRYHSEQWINPRDPPPYPDNDVGHVEHVYESPVFARRARQEAEMDGPQYYDLDPDIASNRDSQSLHSLGDLTGNYRMLNNNNMSTNPNGTIGRRELPIPCLDVR